VFCTVRRDRGQGPEAAFKGAQAESLMANKLRRWSARCEGNGAAIVTRLMAGLRVALGWIVRSQIARRRELRGPQGKSRPRQNP
jgi:hypothetical protein